MYRTKSVGCRRWDDLHNDRLKYLLLALISKCKHETTFTIADFRSTKVPHCRISVLNDDEQNHFGGSDSLLFDLIVDLLE